MAIARALSSLRQTAIITLLLSTFALSANGVTAAPAKTITIQGARLPIAQNCEAEQYDCALQLAPGGPATIYWAWQDARNHYRLDLTASGAALTCVQNGESRLLDRADGNFLPQKAPLPLVLRRRAHMLYVQLNRRVFLHAMDSHFATGLVAGARLKATGLQPAEDVGFSDDFMRTDQEQQLGEWTKVSGAWQFHSVKETNVNADVRLSVNPFSLGGKDPHGALVTVGYPFWCDYEFSASVKSAGAKAGLAFSYRGKQDYFLFLVDLRGVRPGPARVEVLRVTPQGRRVLAAGTVRAGNGEWYRLAVRTNGARYQALLDGSVLFDENDPECIGGPAGLYTEGEAESYFDDVKAESADAFPFDRAAALRHDGTPLASQWQLSEASGLAQLATKDKTLSRYLLGDPCWEGGVIETKVRTEGDGGWAGILFGYQDEQNWNLARWRCGKGNTPAGLQVIRCAAGKKQVLAQANVALSAGRWHTLQVDCTPEGFAHIVCDGRLRLRVPFSEAPRGRAGLYTLGIARATFEAPTLRLNRPLVEETPTENQVFLNDPFMQLWSSPKGQWYPVNGMPNAYWNKGDFFDAYTIGVPVLPGLDLAFAADTQDFAGGYHLEIAAVTGEKKTYQVTLKRLGKSVKTAKFSRENEASPVLLHHSGDVVWVTYEGQQLLMLHDPQPLNGRMVGVRAAVAFDVGALDVKRENVLDYPFEEASCDWEQYGNWVVTNRFSCTPTWSHMTALADRACILWNKYAYDGDLTLEFYAGMRMQSDNSLYYPRVGDMNVTFCGDGRDLASGYSYLVGAWDPNWSEKWTRLLRGAQTAAQTDRFLAPRVREAPGQRLIPVPWVADGRPVHGAWYYIKVRRIGNHVECYFDNVKALSYDDPHPLDGRFFAIWTQLNQMVIAKVRVTYQRREAPKRLLSREPIASTAHAKSTAALVPTAPLPAAPTLTSSNAPGLLAAFEQPGERWEQTGSLRDTEVARVPGGPAGSAACLRVTNVTPGADLGVKVPVPAGLDASRAWLQFDYSIPPQAKLHLYVKLADRLHFIRMSGAQADSSMLPLLGSIPVQADGKWHHAVFNLAAAVAARYPGKQPLPVQEMSFGHFHEGYLRAGIGGNGPGVSYRLDNFVLATVAPAAPAFTWVAAADPTAPKDAKPGFAFAYDHNPNGQPATAKATTDTGATLKDLAPGLWFAHLRSRRGNGAWSAVANLPFLVAAPSVTLRPLGIHDGDAWGGAPLRFQVEPAGSLPLDLTRLAVTVNKTPLDKPARFARYDADRQQLTLDLRHAGLSFPEKQPLALALQIAAPNTPAIESKLNLFFSRALDKQGPAAPVVKSAGSNVDFEDETVPLPQTETLLARDTTTAASGKASLRVTYPRLNSDNPVYLSTQAINAGSTPLLRFSYRVPDTLCANLGIASAQTQVGVTFTDRDDWLPVLGKIADVQRDDQWHTAEVNLRRILSRLRFSPRQYTVWQTWLSDRGYRGGAPGATYWLDDIQFIPAASGQAGIPLSWTASDPSGIQAYRYKWSDKAIDTPDTLLPGSAAEFTFRGIAAGLRYFHIQAQDSAGNWGETAHLPFLIENTPPAIGTPIPAPGPLNSARWTLPLSDEDSGFDPAALRVSINGKSYPLEEFLTSYDAEKKLLVWEWPLAAEQFSGPIADGQTVDFALAPVKDFAGNVAPGATYHYTVRYAGDQEPPRAPALESQGPKVICRDSFTRDLSQWGAYGTAMESVERFLDPERQDYCVRASTSNNDTGCTVRSTPFDAAQAPFIAFEYRCPANVNLHLMLLIDDSWYAIPLSGKDPYYRNLDPAPGFQSDGQWHTIVFNYLDILRRAGIKDASVMVRNLALWHRNSPGGQFYYVDNFQIFGSGGADLPVSWQAADPTGIAAFRYRADQDPQAGFTGGTETSERQTTLKGLTPGFWFVRVSARDGAGNWSAPALLAHHVSN